LRKFAYRWFVSKDGTTLSLLGWVCFVLALIVIVIAARHVTMHLYHPVGHVEPPARSTTAAPYK